MGEKACEKEGPIPWGSRKKETKKGHLRLEKGEKHRKKGRWEVGRPETWDNCNGRGLERG